MTQSHKPELRSKCWKRLRKEVPSLCRGVCAMSALLLPLQQVPLIHHLPCASGPASLCLLVLFCQSPGILHNPSISFPVPMHLFFCVLPLPVPNCPNLSPVSAGAQCSLRPKLPTLSASLLVVNFTALLCDFILLGACCFPTVLSVGSFFPSTSLFYLKCVKVFLAPHCCFQTSPPLFPVNIHRSAASSFRLHHPLPILFLAILQSISWRFGLLLLPKITPLNYL